MPSSYRPRGQDRVQDRGRGGGGGDRGDAKLCDWLKKKGDAAAFTSPDAWPTTRQVLERARRRLGAPAITDLKVATSSGSCLTLLYKGADVVVQHFTQHGIDAPGRAYKVIQRMKVEQDARLKNLAEIFAFDPVLRVIVVEKIEALNQTYDLLNERNGRPSPRDFLADDDEMARLVTDVAAAAAAFSEHMGMRQYDERLDNVGIKGGNYALYDYGMTNITDFTDKKNVEDATKVINKSINTQRKNHGVRL